MRKLYIYILFIFVCSCATDVIMVDITDYDTIVTDSTSYNDKYKIGFKADINSLYNTKSIFPSQKIVILIFMRISLEQTH